MQAVKTDNHRVLLIILDGWGQGDGSHRDAIASTPTPNLDALRAKYPHAQLITCGEQVGLPEGQMGNSEVGHLNIGAGRIVYQDLVRINRDITSGAIEHNPALTEAIDYAKKQGKALHFMGLLSDGGVHSLNKHLYKLCQMASDSGLERVYVHAFMDGRDTDPHSGLGFMQELQDAIKGTSVRVASIVGRYYAMDRDKRWERIKRAYQLVVHGEGHPCTDPCQGIQESYDHGVTDEFIEPIVMVDAQGQPLGRIQEGDAVVCFNFRTDRLRELTVVLTQQDMPEHDMHRIPLHYVTMTRYDESFKGLAVAYDKENLHDTLGEVVAAHGLHQLRIAETEKYAHVTFFFSGGREAVFPGEERILVPSPKVATYDLQPEMSANIVTDKLVEALAQEKYDFICLNFANGDMVGHTGLYAAIQKAVATVDACLGRLYDTARQHGYDMLIIADHGNADNAINPDGTPNTAHSLNPVPIIAVTDRFRHVDSGILADEAPTLHQLLDLPQPEAMTGNPLLH